MDAISVDLALSYLAAGLSVMPAHRAQKRPAVGAWKTWARRLPSGYEIREWFGNHPDAVCVATGKVSGNLECIDFDNHGELFDKWRSLIDSAIFSRLVVEQTPSGGYHALYRVDDHTVSGNLKLARGVRDGKTLTLIETRGENGIFLCSPTLGYKLIQGEFAHIPSITILERDTLIAAARALDEMSPADSADHADFADWGDTGDFSKEKRRNESALSAGENFLIRPGDDFCERGEIRPILESHGWQFLGVKPDGNELWRRPGKTSGGHSATFDGNVFYVFSSNADPFEPERGYSRFQVFAMLACGGDFTRAARELLAQGYGEAEKPAEVDFSGLSLAGTEPRRQEPPSLLSVGELVDRYPKLRPALIHGFLRRGETMNIIAPPKTGKSWLVTDLALSVATGTEWFGFPCERGKVLIIDNELHPETSANRIPKVIEARGVDFARVKDSIFIDSQRGRLDTIEGLSRRIGALKPYGFKLVIIDAFYRAIPKGTDENDNGAVAGIYNLIDRYAAALDCAFVLIHHTSKGNQSLKSVTDVGAGAGSQSRAADTHVILRNHREKGAVVMESVVRSFPSVEPVCLRWNWPLWNRDDSLDPADLDGKKEDKRADEPSPERIAEKLAELVKEPPPVKGVFIETVRSFYGVQAKTARLAVESAIASGLIRCERLDHPPSGQHAAKFILPPLKNMEIPG